MNPPSDAEEYRERKNNHLFLCEPLRFIPEKLYKASFSDRANTAGCRFGNAGRPLASDAGRHRHRLQLLGY